MTEDGGNKVTLTVGHPLLWRVRGLGHLDRKVDKDWSSVFVSKFSLTIQS